MAVEQTIPDIIELSRICQYLASNGIDFGNAFEGGTSLEQLSKKIYDIRKGLEWAYDQNYIAASAVGSFLVEDDGNGFNEGDVINVYSPDPVLGTVLIGTYVLNSSDTTTTLIAQHTAAAINGFGYTGTNNGALAVVTAPFVLGNLMNGLYLIVEYVPNPNPPTNYLLINGTDRLLINSTDKFLI